MKVTLTCLASCACSVLQAQQVTVETFANNAQQAPAVSGGTWNGGARPGLIGGDGRHGSFDPTLGIALGGNVFEWDTDLFVIPASSSLTGQQYTVTDGQFYFSDMTVQAGTTIRFTGSTPPIIRVRGDVEILGTIDVSGVDIPGTIQTSGPATGLRVSTFNARIGTPTTPVMPGTSGGPGGGRGGDGGQESDNASNLATCNGQPGEDVQVGASHAYAGSTTGTGGAGSPQQPANGVWANPPALVGPGLGIYCGYFSNGGGGGGFAAPGTGSLVPQHINPLYTVAGTTPAPGGAAFSLLPFPPNPLPTGYTSLDHFMVGGSGGGGGGSHGYGLLAVGGGPPTGERWMKGHAGSGGGGTAAIRCGGTMTIAATATLSSRGGSGVVISGDDPVNTVTTDQYGISSPGGGGSGGSFLLQAAKSLSFAGTMDTRGGLGSTVGFIANNLQAMTGGAGDGADGFFRLESDVNVAFGGTAFPPFVVGANSGGLTDRDNLSGDASLWYVTGLVSPPTWERYELDVDTDGDGVVDITYSDSGAPGTQKAYETAVVGSGTVATPVTLPVVIEFQGAQFAPSGTTPIPGTIKPWREGIGSGAGPGIELDAATGFRFRATYNRGLFPGMALQQLRVYWTGGTPPTTTPATATPFGTACGSPNLTLASVARPIIGQSAVVELSNAPTAIVGINVGISNTFSFPVALPYELSAAGMPGCFIHASSEAFGLPLTQTASGDWQYSQPVPLAPNLVGQHFYVQGFAYAPGTNAANIITSNGLDWEIGDV